MEMAKQVWFVLPEEDSFDGNGSVNLTELSSLSQYTLPDMDGSKEETSEQEISVPEAGGGYNQDGSYNDSRDDASTQMSSPSLQRGFSSDDGSGWRSETTETSEDYSVQTEYPSSQSDTGSGNISLPQYPIDDRSADESAPENSDVQEEALSSAINEVSKDFISGNFSPSKYPHVGSGDSDSYSDGDQRVGNEQRGAVYARYPESATGLSDCEWNPYATESDTNHTPRSSNSESSNRGINDNLVSESKKGKYWNDPINSVARVNAPHAEKNTAAGVGKKDFKHQSYPNVDSGGESDRSSKQSSRSPTFEEEYHISKGNSASYMLYPPEQQVLSDNSDTDSIKQRKQADPQTGKNVLVPNKHEGGEPVASYKPYIGDAAKAKQAISQKQEVVRKNPDANSATQIESNGKKNIEDRLKTNPQTKLPERTESLSQRPANGDRLSESKSLGNFISDSERRMSKPQRERLSDGALSRRNETAEVMKKDEKNGRSSLPDPDTLSERVTKLLDEANNLGAALHSTLYESKGNVLGPPKYNAFSPDKVKYLPSIEHDGLAENKVREQRKPVQLERVTDNNLENSGKSNASLQSGVSSLSEEVAKLMSKVEETNNKSDSDRSEGKKRTPAIVHETPAHRKEEEPLSKNGYERRDLDKIYKSISQRKEPGSRECKSFPGSQKNYDSDDSLGERVKDLLARTTHTDKMEFPAAESKIKSLPYQSHVSTHLDYSLLQRDLQEIQNSLDTQLNLPSDEQDKDSSGRSSEKDLCLDGSKSSDKSSSTLPGSARDRKLLWDHAADLGYDSSESGKFHGKFQDFATSDTEKTLFSQTGIDKTYESVASKPEEATLTNVNNENEEVEVVPDQLEDLNDVPSTHLAPDVEEIIAKYQNEKQQIENRYQEDTSGLASRVFQILTREPPQKQVFGILEEAMEQEREMMQKLAERPKMDSSYHDDFSLESGSFVVRDKDIKKQLDWSAMSSINGENQNDKMSDLSTLAGLTSAPFSALGNAQTFLSSQLQKTSERTFNHSIEMNTPYKRVIECYPLYGVERDKKTTTESGSEPPGAKEAWAERPQNKNENTSVSDQERPENRDGGSNGDLQRQRMDRLASERFFLTDQDLTPDRLNSRPRTLSDPIELSPERERHKRSHSEEARMVGSDDKYYSLDQGKPSVTDRRSLASPTYQKDDDEINDPIRSPRTLRTDADKFEEVQRSSIPLQVDVELPNSSELQQSREETYGSNSIQEQMTHSPTDSDSSSRRKETTRLRPYRPVGSRDLYYTESGDDSGSVADSITTMESTHTGSDDALGPTLPPQYLGSRQENSSSGSSSGIYSNRLPSKSAVLSEALSTIEEKSISDEKEKSSVGDDRNENLGSVSEEDHGRPKATDNPSSSLHQHDSGLDLGGRSRERERYDRPDGSNSSGSDIGRRIASHGNVEGDMASSIRSDPGEHFGTPKQSRKYEIPSYNPQFEETSDRNLSEERVYGRSRSRSETDLYNLPLDSEHKASSPVYGAKLMEMSSRPSPIYSHHSTPAVEPEDVRMHDARSSTHRPGDNPVQDGRRYVTGTDLGKPPTIRELSSIGPMEARAFGLRSAEEPLSQKSKTVDDPYLKERIYSRPLEKGPDYFDAFIRQSNQTTNPTETVSRQYDNPRLEDREKNPRPYIDQLRQDDREIIPRHTERVNEQRRDIMLETRRLYSPVMEPRRSVSPEYVRRSLSPVGNVEAVMEVDGRVFRELPKVPDNDFEETVRQERDRLKGELTQKMGKITKKLLTGHLSEEDEHEVGEEVDHIPLSSRAKALQERLERQHVEYMPSNINDMWDRFQELNQDESESSLNASRMETLANLLKNPTRHLVQKYLDDRDYERYKEKKLLEELAALERQHRRHELENRRQELKSYQEEDHGLEKERKRQELQNRRRHISEEESNGSYAEILAQNERKKLESDKKKKDKNVQNKSSKKSKVNKLGDSADTLFSIPEDVSLDMSDLNKTSESEMMLKAKHERHRHVIDPLMSKLRTKVQRQRDKIDKERRKELRRMEKLQKLEMLLTAKRKGKLSDKAINAELDYVSTTSTTMTSDSSTVVDSSESTLTANSSEMDSDRATVDTTSTKDSSIEYQKTKARKQSQLKEAYKAALKSGYMMDDSETQSENDIFQKPRKSKSAKHDSERKKSSKTKGKKSKSEKEMGDGSKKRKDKERYNKLVQTLSPSERKWRDHSPYEKRERSPGGRRYKEVGTMYPSPISISPPRRKKHHKDVSMVSEAIQTTLRSLSPSHDERRVVSVPLMSPERKHRSRSPPFKVKSKNTSPLRSRSSSPSKSRSPIATRRRQESRSPLRTTFDSEYHKTPPPPKSKMFTPETPDDDFQVQSPSSPKGVSWYIPMTESKPWRKPLKEQQAYAVGKEPWQPKSVPREVWKSIVDGEGLRHNTDTKFCLDPPGQPMDVQNNSDEENMDPRPRTKMSLQEAFQIYKQDLISRSRARERRVLLASEHRELQNLLHKEREKLFAAEQRKKEANPEAHPYSENLHKPKRRTMTKEEMKELTEKKYKKLPEVVEGEKLKKRNNEYALNRLRAKVFNRNTATGSQEKISDVRERRGKSSTKRGQSSDSVVVRTL